MEEVGVEADADVVVEKEVPYLLLLPSPSSGITANAATKEQGIDLATEGFHALWVYLQICRSDLQSIGGDQAWHRLGINLASLPLSSPQQADIDIDIDINININTYLNSPTRSDQTLTSLLDFSQIYVYPAQTNVKVKLTNHTTVVRSDGRKRSCSDTS